MWNSPIQREQAQPWSPQGQEEYDLVFKVKNATRKELIKKDKIRKKRKVWGVKEKNIKSLMRKKKRDPHHGGGMSVSLLKFLRTDFLRQREIQEQRREELELGQGQGSPLRDATLLLQDPVLVDSMLEPVEARVHAGKEVGESLAPHQNLPTGNMKTGMTGKAQALAHQAKAKGDALQDVAKKNMPAGANVVPAGVAGNMLETNNLDAPNKIAGWQGMVDNNEKNKKVQWQLDQIQQKQDAKKNKKLLAEQKKLLVEKAANKTKKDDLMSRVLYQCEGRKQSPIDVPKKAASPQTKHRIPKLEFYYQAATLQPQNEGTVRYFLKVLAGPKGMPTLAIGKEEFILKRIWVKSGAEHTIQGIRHALELQYEHESASDSMNKAIVSAFYRV